ncbi:MAG TPA: type IIL restriction-modification enzyme MmeI, partial [Thermoanaerobaculia bacterium]|nr:type IIL restriction-modification enzyme MmeI [Thermoanaerobaculia bacterium]
MNITDFVTRWKPSASSERSNSQTFLGELCDLLGVPRPDPKVGDPDRDRYVFEREAILHHEGGRQSLGFIDLYKQGFFILEAKQGSEADSLKAGHARRHTPAWEIAMQRAYGQALKYSQTIEDPPPFIVITDIGYCFDLYASFDGTRNYRKFPDAVNSRIYLEKLESRPEDLETLKQIFLDPHALDPSRRTAKVTREIAGYIARLAKALQESGHEPERVAKFLMRCLFTMYAEDTELLPKGIFGDEIPKWAEKPESFVGEVSDLWRRMNEGGDLYGKGHIWQFNGGLFADPFALPLNRQQLLILGLAAKSDWKDVEPAIFGTLLERALDPKERHRLGAHYTPRAYVERLVRPTIEEPLRGEWDSVRASVQKLIADVDPQKNIKVVAEARKLVYAFYDRLTKIRVLDPACGSGNFLFVALDLFKRIENEVIDLLDKLGDTRAMYAPSGRTVTPEQFLGIEIKPWAKEITELVLWIGYLQWQTRTRGWKSNPQEPILRDYHNIECRDAVLAYDAVELLLDDEGNPVTRWDGETMK